MLLNLGFVCLSYHFGFPLQSPQLFFNGEIKKFILPLLVAAGIAASAQEVLIKRIELENQKVFVFYELNDSTRDRFYTINLYSSRDNFISPLQKLKGDIGLEVRPGSQRRIEINANEEFGNSFEGKVAFELRAKVYIPFIRLEGFNDYKKFKRGKPYEIHWSGGRPQNVLNFELYNGDTKITSFTNIANAGKYNLIFAPNTKPGKNYRFKISDSKNKDEIINTGTFTIAPKIPLILKTLPVLAIGGALIFLSPRKKSDCEGCLMDFPDVPPDN
jgi:hypothetical protein